MSWYINGSSWSQNTSQPADMFNGSISIPFQEGEIGYAIQRCGDHYIAHPIEVVNNIVKPSSWLSNVFDKNLIKFRFVNQNYVPITKEEVEWISIFAKIILSPDAFTRPYQPIERYVNDTNNWTAPDLKYNQWYYDYRTTNNSRQWYYETSANIPITQ